MASTIQKKKERFIGIPYRVANSHTFAMLSALEIKFIVDLLVQYQGKNNGALSPTHSLFQKRGWAKSSLYRTFVSLEAKGFIVVTRRGWKERGKATMVAITWLAIDEVSSITYDDGIKSSAVPLGYWCTAPQSWVHKPTLKPAAKVAKNALHSGTDNGVSVP